VKPLETQQGAPSVMETVEVDCNLCGANDASFWGKPRDGLRLVRCRRCDLIYVNPRPSLRSLQEFYRQEYFDGGDYSSNEQRHQMYQIEIAHMLPWSGSTGRFLDIGCAMGAFLKMLPGSFEKFGVEFSEDAARYARQVLGLNVRVGQLSEISLENDFYDVVQMRGVIEHLPNPALDIVCVNRALKMNWLFILNQTPNVYGAAGRFFKEMVN
jgi:SAM-dependent methyltransferase